LLLNVEVVQARLRRLGGKVSRAKSARGRGNPHDGGAAWDGLQYRVPRGSGNTWASTERKSGKERGTGVQAQRTAMLHAFIGPREERRGMGGMSRAFAHRAKPGERYCKEDGRHPVTKVL